MERFFGIATMFTMLVQEIMDSSFFHGLSLQQAGRLSPLIDSCRVEPEQAFFEQGQPAEYIYFLQRGQVAVYFKPYDGPPLTITRIEPGGVFGWSALMGRGEYNSRACAMQVSQAFRLRACCLSRLRKLDPETGNRVLECLAAQISGRLRSTNREILRILIHGTDQTADHCLDRKGDYGRSNLQLHGRGTASWLD